MKRLLIGDAREELLSTTEIILRNWGYRVVVSSRPEKLLSFLQESTFDLLIFGSRLLAGPDPGLFRAVEAKMADTSVPLIVLREPEWPDPIEAPHEALDVPLDVFTLFQMAQSHLERFPRKNMRLPVRLPGILYRGGQSFIAEILSISARGLFVKTGFRIDPADRPNLVFPLLGMKKEVEIAGRVIYRIDPSPDNNYLQGFGFEFEDLDPEVLASMEAFIEGLFLGELTSGRWEGRDLDRKELKSRSGHLTLRIDSPPNKLRTGGSG